jgi:CheY-like chemotaxis protein
VVEALRQSTATDRIPILIVTAKHLTREERSRLNGYVSAVVEKGDFDRDRFTTEVRRAMTGRVKT